jgi:asparagine synthase (glutamine-hydrolysing)
MSGLFGIIEPDRHSGIGKNLARMGALMAHRDWYVMETHCDEEQGLGMGRIGIGIFNQGGQPRVLPDAGLMGFLTGELFETQGLLRELKEDGYALEPDDNLGLILRLYQRQGESFIDRLQGAFFLLIWDQRNGKVLLGCDRFGLYPHFLSAKRGRLVFAPEVKAILSYPSIPKELDFTALAEYVRFQHLLGDKTFFQDVHLFPNASLLSFDLSGGGYAIRRYWTPEKIPFQEGIDFNTAVEEAGRLLRQAVERRSQDAHKVGVYLSGGLDSRTILGFMNHVPVSTLTYGHPDSNDVRLARRIARAAGSDHHWCDLPDSEWIKENLDFHLELTEGFHSWIHIHGMSTLPLAREIMQVNLTGWDV